MNSEQRLVERLEKPLAILFVLVAMVACAMFTLKLGTNFNSSTVAQILIIVFTGVAVTSPRVGIVITFCYVGVLGDIRRWFQFQSSTAEFDLLLLVAPISALVIFARPLFRSQIRVDSKLSKWVMILLGIMTIQILNIAYVPIQVNIAGGLFYIIPLVWFWIGKCYGDQEFTENLLFRAIFGVGVAACLFGLYQTFVDFPDYQKEWILQNAKKGVIAINVGTRTRAFGFFVSFQEYAHYVALVVVLAICGTTFKKLRFVVLFLPFALLALFTTGARGPVVFVLLSVCATWMIMAKGSVTSTGRLFLFVLIVGFGLYFGLTAANNADLGEDINPLVQRQADGLMNPLDSRKSTATDHGFLFLSGVLQSFSDFSGKGLGSTTLAGNKFGVSIDGTEMDISNLFVALSPVGGVVYIIVIGMVFKYAGLLSRKHRSPVAVAVLAILFTQFTQWLNGGLYAIAPVLWFCIGAIDRQYKQYEAGELLPSSRMG